MTTRARLSDPAMSIADAVAVELIAVLVAVTDGEPRVLAVRDGAALPSGPFETVHRSLQSGLRSWVEAQTRHPLGYVEQLYTFADRDRRRDDGGHAVSISYLGLTRERPSDGTRERPSAGARERAAGGAHEVGWRGWYEYFPWEDHRAGRPALIDREILPRLDQWSAGHRDRRERVTITFGACGGARGGAPGSTTGDEPEGWNEELTLQRFELLFEAGLVAESGGRASTPGRAMLSDHRRILATGIARLRAKIKYRPVVFELMPPEFTLLQLQRSVEAIAGRLVHKQNFRRLIEQQELVEETGKTAPATGGRPARLVRFRGAVLAERAVAGTKLPLSRG